MKSRVRVLGAFLGAAMLVGGWGVAHAQDYPPATEEECVRTADASGSLATTFAPGEEIIVSGQSSDPENSPCFESGSVVQIFFVQSEELIAQTQADGQGNYATTARIPGDARSGSAAIEARGFLNGDGVVYSRSITIVAPEPARPVSPVLPVTGQDIAVLAMWGVGFVALGTTLVTAVRRRRRRTGLGF